MNSNFSIARSWIGDVTDPSNRVRGFSMVGLMWGAGSIVGPALGGVLSNPQENLEFLHIEPGSFFSVHPYVLPSFVGASVTAIALVSTYFFLPESKQSILDKRNKPIELESVVTDTASGVADEESLLTVEEGLKVENPPHADEAEYGLYDVDITNTPKKDEATGFFGKLKHKIWKSKAKKDYVKMRQEKSSENLTVETKKKPGISLVFKSKSVLAACMLICIQGSSVVAIDDLFPLWASTPPPEGLGFSSKQIGVAWSIGGTAMLIFQAFIYPKLIGWLSPLGGVRWGSFFFSFVFLSYPFLAKIVNTPYIWVGLGAVLVGRYVCGSTSGTTLNIILNTVGGPEVQKHRGVVNGFSMSLRGAAMACSPFLASSIFAWSVGNGLSFPLNYFLEFIILAMCALFVCFGSFLIPRNET